MQIIEDYQGTRATESVIALGNFDGVHLGHQAVIQSAIDIAKKTNKPSAILTFEPHPAVILGKNIKNIRLTPFQEKCELIEKMGVDYLFPIEFTKDFSLINANDFIYNILVTNLGISHAVIGYDFIFGHNREGNYEMLKQASERYKFGFSRVQAIGDEEVFSSTKIREFIKNGDISNATKILGYDFFIQGIIEKGAQRGRELGFPTANISLKDYFRPKFGVYSCIVEINSTQFPAIVNIGNKPTFNGKSDLAEVHIFDFNEDIYGQRIKIILKDFIRAEQKFSSIDQLKQQITKDCEAVKACF